MSRHSPQIALAAARRELGYAEQECPHWDHEGHDSDSMHECCYRLREARIAVRAAKRAAERVA